MNKETVFKWIWEECPAKNGDKLVLLAMACFWKDGRCWVAPEMMRHKTGMTDRNIYRCLKRCEASGWIKDMKAPRRKSGQRMAKHYCFPLVTDKLSVEGSLFTDKLSESSDKLSYYKDTKNNSSSATTEEKETPRLTILDQSPNPPLSESQKKKGPAKRDGALGLHLSDADWLESLAKKPEYAHINVYAKRDKLIAWCAARGEKLTRQRLKKCLDKDAQEQVMGAPAPKPVRIVRDEFEEMKRELAAG